MNIINKNGIAIFCGDEVILSDTQSALDMIGDASYQAGSNRIVIFQKNITNDFFKLSTGVLGEVLQKFVTYGVSLAIVGDFSKYTSKPLKDFIYESNKGGHVFFVADEQSAIKKLMTNV